ncbi:filamentous hemagglutinin N-terminal domain-containing protein [Luteibacter pinisoli]|uniref:Filamentous hemagglutinin N-terminal domain-containing protein n=1 Tax=Luteibacter pinisoli TaxID=2589080 RepID=A0A4Y5Z4A0_9GAMM|nr:filamentous haemagglutinin family protein [Luteibacter pinisoli]QDE40007.1 filamentous hemagglutinin N-terminal domain-containing protein [Luteibacter pinisoli]
MIVRHQPATTRRPVPTPRPTLRRRAVCQFIAMALFGGSVAHAATPPAFSPAWFAQKQQQAATAPSQPAGGNGNTVSYTPGSALLQQRVQQSITNLNNAAASLAAQMQQQKDAQAAAAQLVSNVPNGLAQGGLQPAAGISTDPSLWQNANAPTDTVAGTKHTVEVKQTAKKAILTWDSFNVGKDTTLYFNQSAGNQAGGANDWIALNRVNDPSSKPSQILGQMKAEGTVYLLNRNGVVFGAGSQVNTHSLIASSLSLFSEDVQASNQVFLSQGLNRPGADLLVASFTDDARHAVVVEKGASISSGTEGFVLLAAPDVTNAGSIIADDGQAILAATTRLGNASLNAPLSVYDPDQSSSDVRNTLVNTGLVQARRGTIELHGTDVSQAGVLVASTSIAHPGQISIFAGRGQAGRDGTQFQIAGKASFAPGSVTAILPEKDGTTTSSSAAADAAFTTGSVNVLGGKVVLSGGALIEAPGGNVTLRAVRPGLAATSEDGRVYIDSGATIDVSGLANVELPMSALLVTIPRVGQNELANSPLLRNSALYTQKNLVVDSSISGTRADGLDWIGSPILNVAGYVENVPRDISQLLTQGGSITLDGTQVIARDGSRLALDGGYLAYQAGWVTTPNLLGADGLIHNISSADPDVAYVGFAGQFTADHARWGVSQTYHSPIMAGTRRWSEEFVQGADAGALTVKASDAVALDGDISAQATTGVRQAANGSQPDGGRFIFSDIPSALTVGARRKGLSVQSTSLVLGNGVDEDTTWDDVEDAVAGVVGPVGNPRDWLVLSSALLGQAGFANVSLSSSSAVVVGSDSTLAVQPGGSVTIAGARIDVDGKISAPAGSISLSTSKPVVAPGQATDADGYSPADITVADGAVLSTRGLWVNDAGRSGDTLQGDRYINGGLISLATKQAYLGDEANRQDGTGSIVLQSGSLLDVSGGGYVDTKGHVALDHGVPVGHGGDVSIKTYATPGANDAIGFGSAIPPLALTEGRVLLGGTIAGDGFAGGGTLALQAAEIRIGGSPDDLVNANGLWLDPGFFAGKGFDNYQLNAITDGTVTAATHVTVQRDNIIADIDALRSLASNGDIYTAGQSHVGTLDAYQRWATRDTSAGHGPGFALTSGDFLSWRLNVQHPEQGAPSYDGVTGTVSVGPGASVVVDAGGTVLLQGTQATLVDGMVEAHGGAITVGTRNLNGGTPQPTITPYVSLGADATLDASGIALINALATPVTGDAGAVGERIVPRTGTVLDGGQVNLTSNAGYVVAGTGALLDVSGAADTFDLPVAGTGLRASTTAYTPSPVWSNGGSINMSAAAGLFSDATVDAHAGSANGDGGSLAVWGEGIDSPLQPFPLATRIVVEAGATTPDLTVPNGVLHVGKDRLANAGLADITLGSVSDDVTQSQSTPVVFAGDVELAATRSVTLQVLSIDSDGGRAYIKAPYVRLLGLGAAPALVGEGRLVVDANTIDMGGDLTLRGWANAAFNATGDIRFVAPSAQAYDATGKPVTGVLSTTGNLDFQAGQLYPVTNYTFAVVANALGAIDADGKPIETSITVHPGGASQTPLSAGGSLLLDADHIEQGGTIRVPSGELVLGVSDTAGQAAEFNIDAGLHPLVATQSVHLASGSVTSVSLDGLIVPYGTTIDGTEWRYNGRAGVATPDLVAPPAKEIGLHGQNLALDAGATVDVSGGGSLQAGEWVPGVGGSRDVLAQYAAKDGSATSGKAQYADGRAVYAILPGKQSSVAAYDAAFAAQGGDAPAVGQQVYLSGMPGLPAGYYTLLPARYAEVPGAYRVVQDTSAVDSTLGRASRQADGGYAVSGYFGNALSGSRDARNTTFIVQSRDTWGQYSQYTYTDADTFFDAQASKAGKVAPRVAADAGRLTLDAGASLALGLALTGEPAKGGRNSQVDIAAEAIQVLGGDTTVKDGYLGVSADQLTKLGAGSLLLGGTRTTTGEGDRVSIQANSVLLGNDAAHPLSGQEIMLVARGDQAGENGIVLAPGSALLASGATNPVGSQPLVFGADAGVDTNGQATPAVSGDGALLRISQNGTAAVIRHDVTGFDGPAGTPTGALSIGAGANVQGGSALTLDATGRMSVSEDAQLGGTAINASANRIAFVGAGVDGGDDGLVLGPRTLDLFRGANEVTLRSRGEMDFLGDVAVSLAHALTLDAGAFVGDGSDVTVQAATLGFGNALGASQGEATTPGGGVFRVAADEVDFGAGSSSLRGFSAFSGTATSGFAGQGAGGMDFGGATVELTAPQFLADSGASTKLLTTGAMRLENAAGTGLTRDTLGGALTLQGGSIDAGMAMKASAGGLVLRATDGDVHVDAGSTLDVAGVNRTFFDTQAYAPGGNLSISSATGAVTIDSGATLLFGGGKAGGDAGSLTLSAAGPVALNGAIDGHAASGYRGAYFTYATGSSVDLDALNQRASAAGATGMLNISSGSGDLALSSGQTLTAGKVYLSANGGTTRIDGTVDASGPVGGHVELYGKNGVDIEGSVLARSSIAAQRGGDVIIGTTGQGSLDNLDPTYGYELVQRADAGVIHVGANALIDVSGGSTAPIAGGRISFRAPLLADGDVPVQVDNARSLVGARDVTIEPYAVWSTADHGTNAAQHFDGIIDPAGWYTRDADGKPVLVAGTWTDATGKVLAAPADDAQLKDYLTRNYFTPTTANADHTGFYGYAGADAASGPGTLMGFIEQPGFAFGGRYSAIANIHVRPGVELSNPADGSGVDAGTIHILTNWNLGAGTTAPDGTIDLAYRYGADAPVFTFRAGGDVDIRASISDGFYQRNTGAVLADPVSPTDPGDPGNPGDPGDPGNPPPTGDNGYGDALLAYQESQAYMDQIAIWDNGTVNLKIGSEAAAGNPDGNINLTQDPNWQALQAPLTNQSANYYANYDRYIDEIGNGTNQKWAYALNDVNTNSQGFLTYAPNGAGAPDPAAYPVYADYATAYETWLEGNFYNIRGSRETTPTPLMQPIDANYNAYSANYGVYIDGHNTYFNYVYNNVGSPFGFGTQIFYAPFAPRSDAASTGGNPAYDSALAAYQSSESYLDNAGIWNNGKVNLKIGSEAAAGNPDSNIDLTQDPNWQALQAPLTGQSANYYTNYGRYIDEVGDGTNQKWAYALNDVNTNSQGFLTYAPNGAGAPDPAAYPVYADYAAAYETWLEGNFYNIRGSRETTPTPLMQPLDADYTAYTTDYATYITGHNTYFNYVYNNVGSPFGFGTQIFYAPFAPRSDAASTGGNPAYDSALAAYQSSESYLDTAGIWNNGKVNLKVGSEAAAGNPDSNIDLTQDPNWQALEAPLTGQSANYYTNYGRYIDEVGDGTNQKWAYALNDVNTNSQGFLTYAPNGAGAPDPAAYPVYADYAAAYETWLEGNFYNIRGSRETTPTPLMQPLDADYTAYTTDYATYITGHNTYFNYVYNNIGSPFGFGTQIFYAPFAPRSDVASGGGGDNGGGGTTVPIPVAAANNSPSNMPSLGNPVSFASATLLSGPSSSFRIIAGADLASADPLAVQAGSSGNVTLDGHFAVKDTLTDPTVVDPKSPLAGKTLLFPTTIRTGTGSIDVVSAGDIRWQDAAAPAAIYTAGQPSEGTTADTGVAVNRPATSGTFTYADLPDMLVSGVVNPDGAGDIQLHAGGSIAALQNPVDTDGSVTKDKAGSSIAQYWWQWMQTGNAADGSRSSINFSNFAQGVMSVGGNVSVEAGGDIKQLAVSLPTTWYLNADGKTFTTVGGGNLDVHAGGEVLSGAYFVSRGIARIDADGAIGADPSLTAVPTGYTGGNSGPAATPVSTLIALQDAQVGVNAREGVDLGGVYNPSYYRGSSFQFILPAGHADYQSYSSASSLAITSTLGDITFGSLLTPGAIFGNGGQAGPFLPATVSMAALDGGINVLTDGVLYPSAQGNLSMLATGDIAFSRQTANDSTGTVFGLSDKTEAVDSRLGATLPIAPTTDEGASSAFSHDEVPLHGADDEPVRIYSLNGDITDGTTAPNGFNYLSLTIIPSKQALIYAGRDIVNLSFLGQHVHDADITRIAAGRDIYDTSFAPNAGYDLYNPNGYALAGRLLLGGPGSFLVEAGRDIGPLTSQLEVAQDVNQAKSPTGIQSVGNLYNVYLPHEGADVNVAFGVGPGVTTEAFLSRYLDTPDTADAFGSFDADLVAFMQRRVEGTVVDTGYVQDKPSISLTVEQACALLAKEPEYVQRQFAEHMLFHMLADVGRDYNDPASPFSGQYKRGYAALDALFPASLGYTSNGAGDGGLNGSQSPITTGNLDIRGTTIQTQQGGDVTIVGPGGQALIGSTSAPAQVTDSNGTVLAGPNTMGVLTLEQGTINMFTDRSVLLAQSRIFTEQGGDVTIWSSNGDINAGQGAKTTAEIPPPVYICDNDAWCRLDARGQVSGAGIATLQTIQGAPGGTVSLIAPRGTVDAGDAGIRVQGGDLIIAAARVANADNIQVSGDTIGIPVTAAVNVGALNAASAAATAATQAAEDVVRKQQSDARDRVPSIISVDVLRDGNNGASILRPEAASPVQVLGSGRLNSASEAALTAEERRNLR